MFYTKEQKYIAELIYAINDIGSTERTSVENQGNHCHKWHGFDACSTLYHSPKVMVVQEEFLPEEASVPISCFDNSSV
jgi:hypothetical protein